MTLQSPSWDLPFEIMCDASDYAVGAVLGQRLEKKPTAISSNKLHDYGERASSGGLRSLEVLALHLGEQEHQLH